MRKNLFPEELKLRVYQVTILPFTGVVDEIDVYDQEHIDLRLLV
jgi:hypothetical protein